MKKLNKQISFKSFFIIALVLTIVKAYSANYYPVDSRTIVSQHNIECIYKHKPINHKFSRTEIHVNKPVKKSAISGNNTIFSTIKLLNKYCLILYNSKISYQLTSINIPFINNSIPVILYKTNITHKSSDKDSPVIA